MKTQIMQNVRVTFQTVEVSGVSVRVYSVDGCIVGNEENVLRVLNPIPAKSDIAFYCGAN
jgi:hypothetical protein